MSERTLEERRSASVTEPHASGPTSVPAPWVWAGALALVGLLAMVHVGQGTAEVSDARIWSALFGGHDAEAADVLWGSRVPRAVAALLVGLGLGVAGGALQVLLRNPLASPDTLGVSAGAGLAVVMSASLGLTLPMLGSVSVACIGGLAVGWLTLLLGGSGTGARLVLAGSALSLACGALTTVFLLLNSVRAQGLVTWMNGSLLLTDLEAARQVAPVLVLAILGLVVMARRMDVLGLGDDAAQLLGVGVRSTRLMGLAGAVVCAACTVAVAGPVGFVGLCAPVAVRLVSHRAPAVRHGWAYLVFSGVVGAGLVLGADVALRAVVGHDAGAVVPTGVITSVVGGVAIVVLARTMPLGSAPSVPAPVRSLPRGYAAITVLTVVVGAVACVGMLLGERPVLLGDLANWIKGDTGLLLTYVLDTRWPRVAAALLAGAALAASGAVVQTVVRNPLADPGLLGVTGGAGLAAVTVTTLWPATAPWAVAACAVLGACGAGALVLVLTGRGLVPMRLVLVGLGCGAALTSLTMAAVVLGDPFSATRALTWLSGTTWGRTAPSLVPAVVAVLVLVPGLCMAHRLLDVLGTDDDRPRLVGVAVARARLAMLTCACVLTAAAVTVAGVVGFVGLIAPHIARRLVGGRALVLLPTSVLVGAALVGASDVVGRTVLAPTTVPIGVVTALLGAPYFISLLWRSRHEL